MKKLQQAIDNLREVFDTYAGKHGACTTLTKRELSALLRKELDIKLTKKGATEFFRELDEDFDSVVNFEEYVTFVVETIRDFNEELYEN